MADTAELSLLLTAKDQASKVLKDAQDNAHGFGKALGDVAKIAGGFVIGAGLLKLPGLLMSAAKAAAEDAASVARLKQAVENTGVSWVKYGAEIEGVIKKGQKLAFTDDQTRDSLSILTAQTGSVTEATKRYALAQDLARGANIDVVTASRLLGKVTEENVNVLARYGISIAKGASETELFGAIQAKFGGQAEAFANSTAGMMARLKDSMGELKEKIGAALLPAMTGLANLALDVLVPGLEKAADFALRLGDSFVKKLTPAVKAASDFLSDLADTLSKKVFGAFASAMQFIGELVHLFSLGLSGGRIGGDFDAVETAAYDLGRAFRDTLIPAFEDVREAFRLFALGLQGGQVGGDISDMKQGFFDLGKIIHDELIPPLTDLLNLFKNNREITLGFAAGIAINTVALGAYVIVAFTAAGLTTALGVAMAVVTSPVFLLAGAIVALTTAGFLLYRNWDAIKAKAEEVWGQLPRPIQAALDFIRNHIQAHIEGVIQIFRGLWEVIKGVVDLVVDLFHGRWREAWEDLKRIASGVLDMLLGTIKAMFGSIPGIILDFAGDAYNAANNFAKGIERGIKDALVGVYNWIVANVINPILSVYNSTIAKLPGVGAIKVSPIAAAGTPATGAHSSGLGGSNPYGLVFDPGGAPGDQYVSPAVLAMRRALRAAGSFASGTSFVPRDMLALLHRGEAVVPAAQNTNGAGGVTVNMPNATIYARDQADAERSAGDLAYGVSLALRVRGVVA